MITTIVLAAVHYLALALGLGGVFLRGRALRSLRGLGVPESSALSRVFSADAIWGVAALLWLATGLARAFGGFEKGTTYYFQNPMFHLKMGLFILIAILEIWPMVTFIRWRMAKARGQELPGFGSIANLIRVNDVQVALVIVIPFVASAMARGYVPF